MRTRPRRPRRVLIRGKALRLLALERFGYTSGSQIAKHLGIDRSTMARLLAGRGQPSGELIATILDAFDVPFEDLFVIAPMADQVAA